MSPKLTLLCVAAACWGATLPQSDYLSAKHKLDAIQRGRLAPGSAVTFTPREIDAWSRVEIPKQIPRGFREPLYFLLPVPLTFLRSWYITWNAADRCIKQSCY